MCAEEKIDVAVNIFAKPYQTALALLSLIRQSGRHIGVLWLQYEPMGSKFDNISPYLPAYYLQEKGFDCRTFQPEYWLGRNAPTPEILADPQKRLAIRYQYAFENSKAPFLFLMHNDIYVFQDILTYLRNGIGDGFAAGSLGQCWNCPAAMSDLTNDVLGRSACKNDNYRNFQISAPELANLYQKAMRQGRLRRRYEIAGTEFDAQPWPLPECRINEWACLINMRLARPLTIPFGSAWPPGAFKNNGANNIEVITSWFRDLHAKGLHASHCDLSKHLKHWVGTGNKSAARYAYSEDRARAILEKDFPDYMRWLDQKTARPKTSLANPVIPD